MLEREQKKKFKKEIWDSFQNLDKIYTQRNKEDAIKNFLGKQTPI